MCYNGIKTMKYDLEEIAIAFIKSYPEGMVVPNVIGEFEAYQQLMIMTNTKPQIQFHWKRFVKQLDEDTKKSKNRRAQVEGYSG